MWGSHMHGSGLMRHLALERTRDVNCLTYGISSLQKSCYIVIVNKEGTQNEFTELLKQHSAS